MLHRIYNKILGDVVMGELVEHIRKYSVRGACRCGECIDAPSNSKECQPTGHTVSLEYFEVALDSNLLEQDKEAVKLELIELVKSHKGEFCDIDLFDGNEYDYMQIGGWIGDQGIAMQLMGMGKLLGIWELYTPSTLFPHFLDDVKLSMAGMGMITIKYLDT